MTKIQILNDYPVSERIMMKEIQILNDNPVSNAKFFNFDAYADAISGITQSKNSGTPLVIGIIGDWGSGKTSLMKTIENKMRTQKNGHSVQTIWFNAWKFDKEDSIRRALLMRVLQELKTGKNDEEKSEEEKKLDQDIKDLQSSLYHEVNREELGNLNFDWKKAAKGTFKISLNLIPGIGTNLTKLIEESTNEKGIANIVDAFQREKTTINIDKVQFLEQFHDKFEEIINKYYVKKSKRVVIFIDDLDRTLPEKALEVLDAIKLFLDVKGCIFILGIDRRVISYIISGKYRELMGKGEENDKRDILITGENYLEKIIQLSFQLPPINDEDIKKFIDDLEGMDSEFYGQFRDLITQGIENNPRKIKRFFNIIELQRNIVEAMELKEKLTEAEKIIYDGLMIVWNIINLNHSEFRDAVLNNQLILKPVLFRALEEYFEFKDRSEEQSEQTMQVEHFLGDKILSNIVTQFHEYIYKHKAQLESKKIPEIKLNNIIEQVISHSSVTGKVEAREIIDLKNQISSLVNEAEKIRNDLGDTFPEQKKGIENLIENIKEALKGENTENIKSLMKELEIVMKDSQLAQAQQEIIVEQEDTPPSKEEEERLETINEAIKTRASLAGEILRKINLNNKNLSFMDLEGADLSKACLEDAKLTHAKLNKAILANATLKGAKLNNAKLWYVDMQEANLKDTNFKDAELYRANLSKANLENANLYNADLMSVNLAGAIMKNANLRQVNLKFAVFDNKTDFRGADIDSVTIDNLMSGTKWNEALWDPYVLDEIKKKMGVTNS